MNTLFDNYEGFIEKFKTKKTTDDCYTPENVYEAVKDYALKLFPDWEGRPVARPFYPGGDYEKYDYDNAIVIDNPPFSIYVKICRYFCEKGIPFFLFAPGNTAVIDDLDLTYVIIKKNVIFTNGASVPISFVTNHPSELRLLTAPDLDAKIAELNKTNSNNKTLTRRRYDDHATSIALLKKFSGIDFFIRKEECVQIKRLQMNKNALFGGGFLVADQVVRRMKLLEMKLQEMKLQEMKLRGMNTIPLSCAEQESVRQLTANCARRKSKEPGHEGDIIF
jgi:hypothetical protein